MKRPSFIALPTRTAADLAKLAASAESVNGHIEAHSAKLGGQLQAHMAKHAEKLRAVYDVTELYEHRHTCIKKMAVASGGAQV